MENLRKNRISNYLDENDYDDWDVIKLNFNYVK